MTGLSTSLNITDKRDPAFGIDALTLHFPPGTESDFIVDHFGRSLGQVRRALLLGLLLYAAFGILDYWITPQHRLQTWTIRFAVVCPVIIFCYALTFSPLFSRLRDLILSIAVFTGAMGIVAITAIISPPGNYLYYAGLLLLIIYYCTFVRLSFLYAVGLSASSFVAYVTVALLIVPTPGPVLLNNIFFLITANILGLSANYAFELNSRRAYAQRRIIEEGSRELKIRNEELQTKNVELAKAREDTLRSSRRAELIFATLTETLPGTLLDGKYRVEEKIGAGGFGTVYRGTHLLLDQTVAIKVFRPRPTADGSDNLDELRREGMTACKLHHRNAVVVMDFGVSGGSIAYLVMEFLSGQSLAAELGQVGALKVMRCAEVLCPVADVLADAHAQGLIHRDVKPNNIFLHNEREQEVVKLIDFGIAKLVDAPSEEAYLQHVSTNVLGSPAYVAPERLRGEYYDGGADVYALGVTAFEALCGRLPFRGGQGAPWSVAVLHLTQEPPSPREFVPDISQRLEELILSCLAKNPADRPTAREFAAGLAATA